MRITTTTNANKTGTSVTARGPQGVRKTITVDPGEDTAHSHGRAARALVSKIAPGYRRNEYLNSVKVVKAETNKTVYLYKD